MSSLPIMIRRLLSLFLISLAVSEQRVPSLNEISKIDDPVLKEVFSSSKSQTTVTEEPPPQQLERQPFQPPRGNYYSGGEVPIQHPEPLGPMPAPQPPANTGLAQLVDTGANVFATGANAFYRGAASVGQAFGVQPANYQIPLFNQAASIFG